MTGEPLHVFTGQSWHLDSNAVDDDRAADVQRLLELGWIRIFVSDQAHVEPM